MARTTRSTTDSKKRKRAHDDAQPTPKRQQIQAQLIYNPAILDILEMIDTQGLLDRVFPVEEHVSLSLRTLLKDPQSLSVLHAAVQHLLPISSLPRTKPSPTVTQQLRFCNLAISLLDQASQHTVPIPLSLSSILPPHSDSEPSLRSLKYALVQHLPSGDYWTSLNSDAALSSALKTLPTAQAELVAILPTPPSTYTKPIPTLGSCSPAKPLNSIKPLPSHRTVTTGAFLDYGISASFAPSFDNDAQIVGRRELGQVLFAWQDKRRHKLRQAWENPCSIEQVPSEDSIVEVDQDSDTDVNAALEELLPPDEVANIKAALSNLELENAVQELLERNRRALVRLENLQISRLAQEGEHSKADEGSEEWDTAQGILQSLTVLASLRPRASSDDDRTSILPPPAILHRLHRTLALEPTSGWYGTLPATARTTALRDDTTVKKSRSTPTSATSTAPTTTSAAVATATTATSTTLPVTVTTPVTIPYSGYTYAYGTAQQQQQQQQPYRPQNGTPTQPYGQFTPQYYPYMNPQAQQQQPGMVQNYYGQQQQGYAAAAYAGWYSAYTAVGGGATTGTASGSGRGTPQPQQVQQQPVQMTGTGTYGSFFGGPTGATGNARTPAVANTVYAPGQVRSGQQQGGQGQQGTYYGAYQPPASTVGTSPSLGR